MTCLIVVWAVGIIEAVDASRVFEAKRLVFQVAAVAIGCADFAFLGESVTKGCCWLSAVRVCEALDTGTSLRAADWRITVKLTVLFRRKRRNGFGFCKKE